MQKFKCNFFEILGFFVLFIHINIIYVYSIQKVEMTYKICFEKF